MKKINRLLSWLLVITMLTGLFPAGATAHDHEHGNAQALSETEIVPEDILLGDVNGDGTVNGTDRNLTFRYVSGTTEFTEKQLLVGDVNCDSNITGADTNLIYRFISHQVETLGLHHELDESVIMSEPTTSLPTLEVVTDTATAQVGDEITFEVWLRDADAFTDGVWNITFEPELPEGLTLVSGSVDPNFELTTGFSGTEFSAETLVFTSFGAATNGYSGSDVVCMSFTCEVLDTVAESHLSVSLTNTEVTDGYYGYEANVISTTVGIETTDPDEPTIPTLEIVTDAVAAQIGDEVTFEVWLRDANTFEDGIWNVSFVLDLPEGLTFVSGSVDPNFDATTGFNSSSFSAETLTFTSFGAATNGYSGGDVVCMSFTCEVLDTVAESHLSVSLTNTEVTDGYYGYEANVISTTVGIETTDPDEPTIPTLEIVTDAVAAQIGDEVTFEVWLRDANTFEDGIWNVSFVLDLPEGLTFVSGSVDPNFDATTGFNSSSFSAETLTFTSFGAATNGYSGGDVVCMSFTCEVLDTVAESHLSVSLTNTEVTDGYYGYEANVISTTVGIETTDPDEPTIPTLEIVTDAVAAQIGDEVTFEVWLRDANTFEDGIWNVSFVLDLPEGLTFVSGSVDPNFDATTGFNSSSFSAETLTFTSFGAATNGYSGGDVVCMSFTCEVLDTVAESHLSVSLTNTEVTDGYYGYEANVISTTVGIETTDPDEPTIPTLEIVTDAVAAQIGDEVTFEVWLRDANTFEDGIWNVSFVLDLPEGLTFVSGSVDPNFDATTGFNSSSFSAETLTFTSFGAATNGYSGGDVICMSFQCRVVLSGELTVSLTNTEVTDGWDGWDANVTDATITSHKHNTETVIPGKDATCTEEGLTEGKKCSICGEITVEQEVIPMLDHTEEVIPGKDATCTEDGLTEGMMCSVCGEILVEQEVIPMLDHTEEVIPGKDATCTEDGLTEGMMCSVCGEILVEQEEIPATGHIEEIIPGKEPTLTETGLTEGKKCSVCGKILLEQEDIPTLDEISGSCGANLTWTLTKDGILTICGTGAMFNFTFVIDLLSQSVIPMNAETAEAAPWSDYNALIAKVIIEDGVTSIGSNAFAACTSLTEIEIPETVTAIGDSAFSGCEALETITYAGSEGQWNKIEIGEGNEPLEENEVQVDILLGDVNGDGKVNGTDTNLIFRHVSGTTELSGNQLKAADVNGDGKVNGTDTNLVFRFVSGTIDSLG